MDRVSEVLNTDYTEINYILYQKNFLIFVLRGLNLDANIHFPSYHRMPSLTIYHLSLLKNRRMMMGVVFLYYLINGNDSQYLLTCINFKVPSRMTRKFHPLLLTLYSSTYTMVSTISYYALPITINLLFLTLCLCNTLPRNTYNFYYLGPTLAIRAVRAAAPLGRLNGR